MNLIWSEGRTGFAIANNAQWLCQGAPNSLVRIAEYNTVQEQCPAGWKMPAYAMVTHFNGTNYSINCRFTDWSVMAQDASHLQIGSINSPAAVQDCQFHGGLIQSGLTSISLSNCLLERVDLEIGPVDSSVGVFRNNTFWRGTFDFWPSVDNSVIQDNLFDGTTIPEGVPGIAYIGGHNAFVTGCDQLDPLQAGDMVLNNSPAYQTNWLGAYYLPPDSPLIDAGSTTADQVGLYDFTTQTAQTEEGVSPVDIGYHYVALDDAGNPVETFTNGIPDYVVDADGDGLPDGWELYWFGDYTHSGSDVDAFNNNTLLYDYQNGLEPNMIRFSIEMANNNVNTSSPNLQLNIVAGLPYYYALLVDDTNFATANWTAYTSSNLTANLGSIEGRHQIWVGLKGLPSDATPTWQGKRVILDFTRPQVVITNPASSMVDVPVIQIYGYCPEPLDNITCDVSNALGLTTNLDAGITGQYYDTNVLDFTTNYFECLDVPLTNGVNVVTFHATDLAGNVTTTNFSFTVDYSNKTAPVVQIAWPQDGMQIGGSTVTLRGQVDDPTVTVTATITDAENNTSTVTGEVERDGRFWVDDLPLNSGNNTVSITMSNVINQTTVSTLNLVQSAVGLALTSPQADDPQLWQQTVSVSGTISDPNYVVWVNGEPGANNGDGTWSADNVPTTSGGVAIFDVTAYPPDEAPDSGLSGHGVNPQTAHAVNLSANGNKPPRLFVKDYHESMAANSDDDHFESHYDDGRLIDEQTINEDYEESMWWSDEQGGDGTSLDTYSGRFHQALPFEYDDSADSSLQPWFSWLATAWPTVTAGPGHQERYYHDLITGEIDQQSYPYANPPTFGFEHCVLFGDLPASDSYSFVDEYGQPGTALMRHHLSFSRAADTPMSLETGGRATSHRQNIFCLSATALSGWLTLAPYWSTTYGGFFNYGTWVPINPTRIKIDGKALGSDGLLWRVYRDNDTRDVTPKVKGVDYYTWSEPTPPKFKLHIYFGGTDVTDSNATVIVGEQISLTCSLDPGAPAITNYLWFVPGITFSNYMADDNTGTLYVDFPKTNNEVDYYWVDGGLKQVSCAVNVAGQPLIANTLFNVIRPQASVYATPNGNIVIDNQVDGATRLHYGLVATNSSGPLQGMIFSVAFQPRPSGTYGWVQLVSYLESEQTNDASGDWYSTDQATDALDNHFLYGFDPFYGYPTTSDSPFSFPLDNFKAVQRFDNMQMWLMFKPDNGQWVPLKKINWNWHASGNKSGSNWTVTSSYNSPNPTAFDSTTHPTWITNVTSFFHLHKE